LEAKEAPKKSKPKEKKKNKEKKMEKLQGSYIMIVGLGRAQNPKPLRDPLRKSWTLLHCIGVIHGRVLKSKLNCFCWL
jgi:hypothetical protein